MAHSHNPLVPRRVTRAPRIRTRPTALENQEYTKEAGRKPTISTAIQGDEESVIKNEKIVTPKITLNHDRILSKRVETEHSRPPRSQHPIIVAMVWFLLLAVLLWCWRMIVADARLPRPVLLNKTAAHQIQITKVRLAFEHACPRSKHEAWNIHLQQVEQGLASTAVKMNELEFHCKTKFRLGAIEAKKGGCHEFWSTLNTTERLAASVVESLDTIDRLFGETLREVRTRLSLTQQQLQEDYHDQLWGIFTVLPFVGDWGKSAQQVTTYNDGEEQLERYDKLLSTIENQSQLLRDEAAPFRLFQTSIASLTTSFANSMSTNSNLEPQRKAGCEPQRVEAASYQLHEYFQTLEREVGDISSG